MPYSGDTAVLPPSSQAFVPQDYNFYFTGPLTISTDAQLIAQSGSSVNTQFLTLNGTLFINSSSVYVAGGYFSPNSSVIGPATAGLSLSSYVYVADGNVFVGFLGTLSLSNGATLFAANSSTLGGELSFGNNANLIAGALTINGGILFSGQCSINDRSAVTGGYFAFAGVDDPSTLPVLAITVRRNASIVFNNWWNTYRLFGPGGLVTYGNSYAMYSNWYPFSVYLYGGFVWTQVSGCVAFI